MKWVDRYLLTEWQVNMIAFDKNDTLWCVGQGENVGLWNTITVGFDDQKYYGGWKLLMLAFDKNNNMWCVRDNNHVGLWDATNQRWQDKGKYGGWDLLMLTFDNNNTMWCVGTDGNVGKWNANNNGWDNYHRPDGWQAIWIAFKPNDPLDQFYCVGAKNNLGRYQIDQGDMLLEEQNWALTTITFARDLAWATGLKGNVGYSDEL